MATEPQFSGFPKGTLKFLRGLAEHNEKAWFDAHRADYQAHLMAPAVAFVSALGPRLRKVSPVVQFQPRINGSIFRMNRDIRFSKDKTPYKTHLDLWFWEGGEKGWETTGFFFRMFPDRLILGAGMHMFAKPQLDAYRTAVLAPKPGAALESLVAMLKRGKYEIGGATRKKVPRGFDESHPRAALLLHEGLFAGYEGPVPKVVHGAGFIAFCIKHFTAISPVNYWLYKHVLRG